jgi:acetolactate synthase I/II/III large subunit
MTQINGAAILAKALKAEGVEVVFSLTGGHIYLVYQELVKLGIKLVDCRHEGAAAFAAEGYAMASGKPGVVLLTAGPGVTNTVTQVCDSMLGDVPVLFIGGASAIIHDLTAVLQEYDCITLMKNNTLWSYRIQETSRIAEALAVGFREMLGAKTGPVYIEVPVDVLQDHLVEEKDIRFPANYRSEYRIFGDPTAIAAAGDLLIAAEKPAIYIGVGTQFNCQNPGVFKELAEYLKIPVQCGFTVKGRFFDDSTDPLFQVGSFAVGTCDVLMLLNQKPNHLEIQGFSPKMKLINVNRNHSNVGLNIPLDVGIIGYSDAVAEQILEYVKSKVPPVKERPWINELVAMREDTAALLMPVFNSPVKLIHPARLAADIIRFLKSEEGKDMCWVPDGGDSVAWPLVAEMLLNLNHPFVGRGHFVCYLGAIGNSMGTLNGLYQSEKRPILHTIGDGSLSQYTGELFSFAKEKIPYVCVIFNDKNWGMIKCGSMFTCPDANHDIGALINNPNAPDGFLHYEAIAQVWGGQGFCVSEPDDILPTIRKAAKSAKDGVPAIVNVLVDCRMDYFSPATVGLYNELTGPPKIRY